MPAISFLPFLQTVPITTRILTLTLLLGSISAMSLNMFAQQHSPKPVYGLDIPFLVLVPGESWRFPWVLITAGFVELSVVELIISLITLPLACRYLQKIWSGRELIRFSIITILGSNIIAFGFSWLTFFVLGSRDPWEGLPYHGLSGLQVGFLVAFTQLIPEHQVQLFGKLKVRVKTLPGLYLLISNILTIILGPSPYMLIQFGFFVSWVYLRFYKLSEDGLSRGDRSETFAFQYWFPPPVRPYISKAANFVHGLATRFNLVPAWDGDAPQQGGGSYAMLPGPGGSRAEAERRRALALKALDARLASGSPAPVAPSPAPGPTSAPVPPAAVSANVKVEKDDAKKEKE